MDLSESKSTDFSRLLAELDDDRAFLLEQIDKEHWKELRPDLAALERELGQLLSRASDTVQEEKNFRDSI